MNYEAYLMGLKSYWNDIEVTEIPQEKDSEWSIPCLINILELEERCNERIADLYSRRPWFLSSMVECKEKMFEVSQQTLFGKLLLQSWSALYMLEKFLSEQKFDVIIELGTSSGALGYFF